VVAPAIAVHAPPPLSQRDHVYGTDVIGGDEVHVPPLVQRSAPPPLSRRSSVVRC